MIMKPFTKTKELTFERTYDASIGDVWRAWTSPDQLREWWGPEKTLVPTCEIDLRVGGRLDVVVEAGQEMGKYAGTRWPMSGTFTLVEEPAKLSYDARSWTEGEEDTTTIEHANELTLTEEGDKTVVHLRITVTSIGRKAKLAVFGMKWGYKSQLDKLERHLGT